MFAVTYLLIVTNLIVIIYGKCPPNQHLVEKPTECGVYGDGKIYTRKFVECICNDGYVFKEDTNICVKKEDCYLTLPYCPYNQHYDGNINYYNVCDDGKITSVKVRSEKCFCNKGMIYDINTKNCIALNQCKPYCPKNQHFEDIIKEHKIFSNGKLTTKMLSGCICNDGLIYNQDINNCATLTDCEPKCSKNQHYENNPTKFKVWTEGKIIIMKAEPRCVCNGDLIYDKLTDECIPVEQCKPICRDTEHYESYGKVYEVCKDAKIITMIGASGCYCNKGLVQNITTNTCMPKSHCKPLCCDVEYYDPKGKMYEVCTDGNIITMIGGPGCYCNKGLIHNKITNTCIPKSQCIPLCPDSKYYESKGKKYEVCIDGDIVTMAGGPGCYCNKGLVHNQTTNTCMPKSQCKPLCCDSKYYEPKGKTYEVCTYGNLITMIGGTGCYCKKGLVQDLTTDTCIPKEQCKSLCRSAEYYEPNGKVYEVCIDGNVVTMTGGPGCYCKKGLVQNQTSNTCIPNDQCKPLCCESKYYEPKGKTYEVCTYGNLITMTGGSGCYCKKGLVQDLTTDTCIPKEQCKSLCRSAEYYEPKGKVYEVCIDGNVVTMTGGPGCYCKKGLVQNQTSNTCIPNDQCKPLCCDSKYYEPKGKTYEVCTYGNLITMTGGTGCYCKKGLVQDLTTDTCIPKEQCKPLCCNAEYYEPVGKMYEVCVDGNVITMTGGPGCYCKKGLVQNQTSNTCIPKDQCKPLCCDSKYYEPKGKSYEVCTEGSILTMVGGPGCYCKKGFVQNLTTNTCIPKEQCKPLCCDTKYYEPRGKMYEVCIDGNIITMTGGPDCYCKKGLVQNQTSNTCIPKDQCKPLCCDSKYYEPKGKKYEVCTDGNIITMTGGPGCYCNKGLVYDQTTDTCILKNQCKPICGNLQYYEPREKTYPIFCDGVIRTMYGKPGCYCIDKYIYNSNIKKCVPIEECEPTPNCPNNLIYKTCGPSSILTCDCINNPKLINYTVCRKGCFCKDGFVYNDATNSCIEKALCPNSTENLECRRKDKHMIFKTCQSSSCIKTCKNPNPTACTLDCRRGCFCEEGYVLCSSGKCITPDKC